MKKKTNIILFSGLAVIFILMVVGVLTCFSVKDNEITTLPNKPEKVEIRDLEAFDAIDNEGICNIVYVQSEKSAVEISAPENYIDRIKTDVDDGVLCIDISGRLRRNHDTKINIKVYSPACKSIKNEGVGNITCDSLRADTLIVKNEGVGSIELNKLAVSCLKADNEGVGKISVEVLDANYVRLDNDGVGSVSISGKAEIAKLINEGVGSIDATELDCEDVGFSNEGLGKVLTKNN